MEGWLGRGGAAPRRNFEVEKNPTILLQADDKRRSDDCEHQMNPVQIR